MTICYWIGYAAEYGYTNLLWNDTDLSNVALAAVSLWIVGFMIKNSFEQYKMFRTCDCLDKRFHEE